jgi:hypothetical protein
VISAADVARVAEANGLPLWLAQGICADIALGERIRAERRSRPRLEKRQHQAVIRSYLLEREGART